MAFNISSNGIISVTRGDTFTAPISVDMGTPIQPLLYLLESHYTFIDMTNFPNLDVRDNYSLYTKGFGPDEENPGYVKGLGYKVLDYFDGAIVLGLTATPTEEAEAFAGLVINGTVEHLAEIDKEIRKIIEESHAKARQIIEENKDDVILIAETLLEKETITAEEIAYLLEHRTLNKEEPVQEVSEQTETAESKEK